MQVRGLEEIIEFIAQNPTNSAADQLFNELLANPEQGLACIKNPALFNQLKYNQMIALIKQNPEALEYVAASLGLNSTSAIQTAHDKFPGDTLGQASLREAWDRVQVLESIYPKTVRPLDLKSLNIYPGGNNINMISSILEKPNNNENIDELNSTYSKLLSRLQSTQPLDPLVRINKTDINDCLKALNEKKEETSDNPQNVEPQNPVSSPTTPEREKDEDEDQAQCSITCTLF